MTSYIYNTSTSLNGFIADGQNSLDWLFAVDADAAPDIASFMDSIGVFVEGSSTYEWVLAAEGLLENPEKWQQFYGSKPTYVFTSRTLPVPDGVNVRFVQGPVSGFLSELREAAAGKDVWIIGGGELAGQFLDAGSLDQVILSVAPVALDSGAPLLPRTVGSDRLTLTDARAFGQFAQLTYAVRP